MVWVDTRGHIALVAGHHSIWNRSSMCLPREAVGKLRATIPSHPTVTEGHTASEPQYAATVRLGHGVTLQTIRQRHGAGRQNVLRFGHALIALLKRLAALDRRAFAAPGGQSF